MDLLGRARGRGRADALNNQQRPLPPAQLLRPMAPTVPPTGRASQIQLTAEEQRGAVVATRGTMRGRRYLLDAVPTRPVRVAENKKGTTGSPVTLAANYFILETLPKWNVYQYHVDFEPQIDATLLRKKLFRTHQDKFGQCQFDGAILYTKTKLNADIVIFSVLRDDGQEYKMKVSFIKIVEMMEETGLMVLNNIVRRVMEGLNLQIVGRNFYDAKAKIPMHEFKLELWPGYITSIRQHENKILLGVEVSTKVMRKQTVHDILHEAIRKLHGNYKGEFTKLVIGTTVLTDYNNKTHRIVDIDWDSSPKSKFNTRDGELSYVEYYKRRYNITIRDENQPMLLTRSTNRRIRAGEAEMIALIPELCRTTGLTDEMKNDYKLMKSLANHTSIGPGLRVQRLLAFNHRLLTTPNSMKIFNEWDMSLDKDLITFKGRELKPEKIVCGTQEVDATLEADWTRSFLGIQFHTSINLSNWYCIVSKRAEREAYTFIEKLQESVRKNGMAINQPKMKIIDNHRIEDYIRGIEFAANCEPQVILIVVPNTDSARYAAIKKKCCVDRAIPTQVILEKTITPKSGNVRSLMSVATKVAIQINCKLGAAPWFIKLPLSGLMVCGFDVYHDTKNKRVSYGALVASMDQKTSCRYFSAVSPHKNGEELTNELDMNMIKALKKYRREHNALPSKIVFYRDGVGEGQLHYVVEHEVVAVKNTINKIYQDAGQELRLVYVIVNKRLNTRLFRGGEHNPRPGTVVDDVITMPERYDFYLVSQNARHGTVSPTSYSIIEDSLMLEPDKLQQLTYKMCHLYYNWSGTIRIPAVCQYAHKLAFLVGQFLHQAPNPSLDNKLFFL